jgi:pilus assembly protein CpaE
MATTIVLVSPADKQPEERLKELGWRHTTIAAAALPRLAQSSADLPDILLVDVREHRSLIADLQAIRSRHPRIAVVIIANLDATLMLEAMRAGLTECIPAPIEGKVLDAALKRVSASPSTTKGELIAVIGAKGGVGTTTVAVNTATTLASIAKRRTLLIDLHPGGGDAAVFLGIEPGFSLLDALGNTHRLDEAFLKGLVSTTPSGLDLLAAPDRGNTTPVDPRRIRSVVEFATKCYRFVVLDVARLEPAVEETLGLASHIVVVATQELTAIRSASRMTAMLRERHGDCVQVVLNRYDRSADIPSEDLERVVGGHLSHRFPSNYRLAIDALNKGRPLVIDNHNKLAASFAAYARSLSGAAKPEAPVEPPSGLLSRLTGRR